MIPIESMRFLLRAVREGIPRHLAAEFTDVDDLIAPAVNYLKALADAQPNQAVIGLSDTADYVAYVMGDRVVVNEHVEGAAGDFVKGGMTANTVFHAVPNRTHLRGDIFEPFFVRKINGQYRAVGLYLERFSTGDEFAPWSEVVIHYFYYTGEVDGETT